MFLIEGVISFKTFEFFSFDQSSLEKQISIKSSLAPILFNYLLKQNLYSSLRNILHYCLLLQRDWARTETYDAVMKVVRHDAGTYGLGVEYAKAMLGEHAREG